MRRKGFEQVTPAYKWAKITRFLQRGATMFADKKTCVVKISYDK